MTYSRLPVLQNTTDNYETHKLLQLITTTCNRSLQYTTDYNNFELELALVPCLRCVAFPVFTHDVSTNRKYVVLTEVKTLILHSRDFGPW